MNNKTVTKREQKLLNQKILLIAELNRIVELLEGDHSRYSRTTAELNNKMHEARRDMIRYSKLMYCYNAERI